MSAEQSRIDEVVAKLDRKRPKAETTEDAVALAFSAEHADALRYVHEWRRWLRWDGTRWAQDRTVETMDAVRRFVRAYSDGDAELGKHLRQAATVAAVERLARSDRRHAAVPEQFDADEFLLNTPAGTVNLRTGTLTEHNPAHGHTKLTTAAPGGACSTWLAFLERITNGDPELQGFLQRMAGYGLTGSVREHALFFLYGTGANGKSTFTDLLSWLLADYAAVAAMDAFTASRGDRHPTDLASLRGARLVTAHETEQGRRWDEARVKALTGGDPIAARFMRGDFFTFLPTFKLMIAGNHKPQLRSVDVAIRRRLHLVPFTAFIPEGERDPDLPLKLRAEAGGILQWCIDGCLAWQREGLQPPASVRDATAEYLDTQDALAAFLEERCAVDANRWELPARLFEAWKEWAEKAGEYVGNQRTFGDRLEAAGFARARGHGGVRRHLGLALKHPG